MSRRRVSNPLALAALACLLERPMHPYEIASTLRERHKDESIRLNYGSLYAVMEALCRNHFIAAKDTERQGNRPERTIYKLTEAGLHELNDWLSELVARPVKEYPQFEAGLSLLPVLPPRDAAALLNARADHLKITIAKEREIGELAHSRNIPRLFMLEREYRMRLLQTEHDWVRQLAQDIDRGAVEGQDEWTGWHSPKGPGGDQT